MQNKQEWLSQMRSMIGEPLKDATGYTDADVNGLLEDLWFAPYESNGQTKAVNEWASDKMVSVRTPSETSNNANEGDDSVNDNKTVLPIPEIRRDESAILTFGKKN